MTATCMNTPDELLDELLAESPERVAARTAYEFDRLADPFQDRVIIFWHGLSGQTGVLRIANRGCPGPGILRQQLEFVGQQDRSLPAAVLETLAIDAE